MHQWNQQDTVSYPSHFTVILVAVLCILDFNCSMSIVVVEQCNTPSRRLYSSVFFFQVNTRSCASKQNWKILVLYSCVCFRSSFSFVGAMYSLEISIFIFISLIREVTRTRNWENNLTFLWDFSGEKKYLSVRKFKMW